MPDWASWTVDEASEQTGYSKEHIRRLIRDKKIEATKFGPFHLIRQESLRQYIQENKDDARFSPKKRGKR